MTDRSAAARKAAATRAANKEREKRYRTDAAIRLRKAQKLAAMLGSPNKNEAAVAASKLEAIRKTVESYRDCPEWSDALLKLKAIAENKSYLSPSERRVGR